MAETHLLRITQDRVDPDKVSVQISHEGSGRNQSNRRRPDGLSAVERKEHMVAQKWGHSNLPVVLGLVELVKTRQ